MAINFDLINQGGGLPKFTPDPKPIGSGGGGALQQLQAQLALEDNARAQEMHQAKLAGQLQANDLALNEDKRSEARLALDTRKTDSSITNETNLTNANVEKINQGIVLDWEKFKVDTDIKYKDYGLREREQNFTEGLRNKQLGQVIKESEHGMGLKDRTFEHNVNMSNKAFNFEVDKYNADQQRQAEYRSQLGQAINAGAQDVVNTLISQGNINDAATWQNTLVNAEKNGVYIGNPEEAKKARAMFAQMAPDVLSTGKLSESNARQWAEMSMSPEQVNGLQQTGKLTDAATISWLAANRNNLSSVVKDPSSIVAFQNGWGPPPKLPDVQEKDRSDFLSGNYNQIKQADQLKKQFALLEEVTKIHELSSGAADPHVMATITDSMQAANTILKGLTGLNIKPIESLDQAFEVVKALKKPIEMSLATQVGEGNDPKANARMFANLQDAMDGGHESIVAFRQSLGLDAKVDNGYVTAAIAETDPSLNVGQIRQKQLAIEDELARLEKRAGRPLSLQEKIDYINARGQ